MYECEYGAVYQAFLPTIYTFTRSAQLAASQPGAHIVGPYSRFEMHGQALLIG